MIKYSLIGILYGVGFSLIGFTDLLGSGMTIIMSLSGGLLLTPHKNIQIDTAIYQAWLGLCGSILMFAWYFQSWNYVIGFSFLILLTLTFLYDRYN